MNQITEMIDPVMGEIIDERQIAEQLLARAKEQGVSKDTISKITDKVIEEMTEWSEPATGPGLPGGVHRRRDPPHHLEHQRDRVSQRPLPVCRPCARALPRTTPRR
jgi:hypothetical protein